MCAVDAAEDETKGLISGRDVTNGEPTAHIIVFSFIAPYPENTFNCDAILSVWDWKIPALKASLNHQILLCGVLQYWDSHWLVGDDVSATRFTNRNRSYVFSGNVCPRLFA